VRLFLIFGAIGMELVAENLDGVAVLNVENVCTGEGLECRECVDVGGLVHNWLLTTGMNYVVIDLQDEKDVCRTFLIEMLQLRKRLRMPFLFAGVMARPKAILEDYDFSATGSPIYATPEEAIAFLESNHKAVIVDTDLSLVRFGEKLLSIRQRNLLRSAEGADETQETDI
jgi:hypothetical protein